MRLSTKKAIPLTQSQLSPSTVNTITIKILQDSMEPQPMGLSSRQSKPHSMKSKSTTLINKISYPLTAILPMAITSKSTR